MHTVRGYKLFSFLLNTCEGCYCPFTASPLCPSFCTTTTTATIPLFNSPICRTLHHSVPILYHYTLPSLCRVSVPFFPLILDHHFVSHPFIPSLSHVVSWTAASHHSHALLIPLIIPPLCPIPLLQSSLLHHYLQSLSSIIERHHYTLHFTPIPPKSAAPLRSITCPITEIHHSTSTCGAEIRFCKGNGSGPQKWL